MSKGYKLINNDGTVTVADAVSPTDAVSLQQLRQEEPQYYMFANIASSIATYLQMIPLASYTPGSIASVPQTVTTAPTLLSTFATNSGVPNVTHIDGGEFTCHYETEKTAGANNYYTYFELYKYAVGGAETLLGTSDHTTETAVNTSVQQTTTCFINTDITLVATDRLVVKIYGVMLSSSATINLRFDDTTNARLSLHI